MVVTLAERVASTSDDTPRCSLCNGQHLLVTSIGPLPIATILENDSYELLCLPCANDRARRAHYQAARSARAP